MPQSSNSEAFSTARHTDSDSDIGSLSAIIKNIILKIQTVTLVEIVKCTNNGELSEVGFVDVKPLVHQLTGDMKTQPHGVIYNIPYFRLQGGNNAVIIDPKPGDIGMCGFCSRDISSVKKNKAASPPGSLRTYDWSDGLYFGGFLNGVPEQYIRFHPEGIEIYSPKSIEITAEKDIQIKAGGRMSSESKEAMSMKSSETMNLESSANMEMKSSQSMNLNSTMPLVAKSDMQVTLSSTMPVGLNSPGITSSGANDMNFKAKGSINIATEKGMNLEADQNINAKGKEIHLNDE